MILTRKIQLFPVGDKEEIDRVCQGAEYVEYYAKATVSARRSNIVWNGDVVWTICRIYD